MKPLRDYVGEALREAGVSNKFDDDPRTEVPPAESLEEFGSQSDQADQDIKEKSKQGKSLFAFPLRAFGDIRLDS